MSSTLLLRLERHAHGGDARHLGVDDVARQAVLGNAEAHHAAGQRAGLAQRHRVAGAAQVIGGGKARRACADHQHPLAGFGLGRREAPALLDGEVAEEALDGIDADGGVELAAVAGAFAGVIADAAHDGGQRVVDGQRPPGRLVVAALGVEQPALDVFARRAGGIAGRQAVDIDRAHGAPRAGVVGLAAADVERDGEGVLHGFRSPAGRIRRCGGRRWPGCGPRAGLPRHP